MEFMGRGALSLSRALSNSLPSLPLPRRVGQIGPRRPGGVTGFVDISAYFWGCKQLYAVIPVVNAPATYLVRTFTVRTYCSLQWNERSAENVQVRMMCG